MIRITFPRALLISFLWHMFCILTVIIVVSPVTAGREKFSKINFIGAILDKDVFGYYKQRRDFGHPDKKYLGGKPIIKESDTAISFAERSLRFASPESYPSKPYTSSITEIIKEKKDLPSDIPILIEKTGMAYSPEVKSEAAGREILFKPSPPAISRTFQVGRISKGEKFQIKLRFLVSPEGKVVFIEKMKSCGYPDIDLMAIRYIKKWQFAPLSPGKLRKNQEGIMLLELEAQ